MLPGAPPGTGAPAVRATTATVPAGFRDELIWSGLDHPTAVRFTPDGSRVFVAQKNGRIVVFDGLADTTPTQVADLSSQVYDYWDRGLLGLAVDPDYPTRPYIYALYTYDTVPWNDGCPSPPGPTTDGCLAAGRLARLTVSGGGLGNSITNQTNLLTDWCQQYPSHSVGTVAFGPEGALYVSGGEGASFTAVRDSGQLGGTQAGNQTPVNPCNDPASQGGTLRSQDVRTTGDPTGLSGSIVRIDPDTGAAWPDNDAAGAADANAARIIGYGLRNPFRFTFDEDGGLWIGDVGYGLVEEINELPDPDAAARNFGWPCYEGPGKQNPYWTAVVGPPAYDPALCTSITGQINPTHSYLHSAEGVTGDGCGTGSSAIAGLTFLRDDTGYPDAYDGGLFWTDYNRKCIWFAPRDDGTGRPDFAARFRFANLRGTTGGTSGAVFLGTTPAGDLIYTSFDAGEVRAVRYYPPNAPPTAVFTATPESGVAPLHVELDASGSTDSNVGDTLSYAWDLDGDGQYDDATGVTAETTIVEVGDVDIGLEVTDDGDPVLSDTVSHTIQAGNTPPNVTMSAPLVTKTWAVGDPIAFSATATDGQDGTVAASAFEWTWAIAHCRPDECHEHEVQTFDGVKSGAFSAPDHGYPSHLKVTLEVTDSDGLTTTVTRELQPKTGTITGVSDPPGIVIGAYDESELEPLPATGIVGSSILVAAPATATLGEGTYAFDQWSDGVDDAERSVPVVAGTTGLTARYGLVRTTDAADVCSKAPLERRGPAWHTGRLPTNADVDWYRFSMAEAGSVRVRLGDLARNASLTLTSGCSTIVASQDRAGTASEELIAKLAAGTYAVRVRPSGGGTASMAPYALQIERLPAGVSIQSVTSRVAGSSLIIVGDVWNAGSTPRGPITITAKLLDASGAVLATRSGPAEASAPGRSRVPFRLTGTLPAGFATVRASVSSTATSAVPVTLTTSAVTQGSSSGRWRVKGTVHAPRALHGLRVDLIQYDAHGDVIDVTRATLGASTLASGATTTFDAWSTMPGGRPDRVRIVAVGIAD